MGGIGDGGGGKKMGMKLTFLNPDGTRVDFFEDNLYELVNEHFLALQEKWSAFLKKKGVTVGFFCRASIGLPENAEIMKGFRAQIDEHNQSVIRNLITLHRETSKKEYDNLVQLAKELGIESAKFNHLEWNKLALEESRKERELR
ncbi:hypothetical protein A2W54_03145 [Candidatus Giovannonibacteria bacterium RIFCSPHIGHO2_02_43_13]|uniref:Uncharacterized protein n=1 Tax=Candidatus Giovannonibacteria bacterium RIFCSPHIGHO2_02_43_13 TaxID=1798330 RepID=A0A1F5WPY4_9BACT|nr:MAG: hypothetical protein UW28_C0039G0011 [Parcubacteria group bacterium GW2011_GWA2_44_13]OGF71876.1 MAG: hypothetical protein A3E06_00425 [Candidatus Giovannonibacteria bacterium RIFCSPHIGHO2_12_FULL_44_42]OGF77743.1 MAG: hypothetical protein A2W54_03145 [Candidatus Giovannonibacteria bacterium RIFCSPHIGHO2_02_43_13]OGF90217.1 MAG: hypothetical protein A3I94_03470 [Candidatus Giovannonibacteria bacterium RIFCSPLOWO2_02_FULL_43_54]OGF96734.1 MAG: hypothetical protein A3H08_02620 [Candidatus